MLYLMTYHKFFQNTYLKIKYHKLNANYNFNTLNEILDNIHLLLQFIMLYNF